MSELPNQRPPQGPGSRGTSEPPGFNWRFAILVVLAFCALVVALFSNSSSRTIKEISYNEFLKFYNQERIYTGSDPKLALKVVTSDSLFDATIIGASLPEPKRLDEKPTREPFQVVISLDVLRSIISENVKIEKSADPGASGLTPISVADFRKAVAYDEVKASDPQMPLTLRAVEGNMATVTGVREVYKTAPPAADALPQAFRVSVPSAIQSDDLRQLLGNGAKWEKNQDWLRQALFSYLPVLLVVMLLFFLFRQQMKAGRGAMSFGKSKARLLTRDHNKVTFRDVAGIQEAKEELWEIVDFLRDPRKFQKLGGAIPKGVLMVGPPGTGKTLLARAIAGEADVPFFSISGSDFVEMFVGVGASRVRDMFEQGKKHAPCLIFIDEIDAVGRHRGHGMGGGHDEREQTLNQLLVEMDGFDTQEGVIIIAATNRPDVLDPALLRPGRFDRQVTVSLPDVNGREEILRVHVKKIKLAAGVDLSRIAKGTPGFSGAELANLINEAALLAARRGLTAVTLDELEEARDKVRWGRERRSLAMSDKEKIGTAWHEAGHAYLNMVLPHTHPLHKVTIIPRGPYLGATMYLPEGDKYSTQKKEALDNLVVTMGGRIAEAFHSDDVSNGASGDIRQATSLARAMVCEWGMSDKLGMIEYGEGDGPVFLGRGDMGGRRANYSEETSRTIDAEIKRFIDEAYQKAYDILTQNRDKVELIAKALLEYETLDAEQVRELIETGEMKNPPNMGPKPPALPPESRKTEVKKASDAPNPDDGPLPGSVVGAHA